MAEGRFYTEWIAVVPDTHAFDVLRWESPDAPRLGVAAPVDQLGHEEGPLEITDSAKEDASVSQGAVSIVTTPETDKAEGELVSPQPAKPETKAPVFVEPLVAPDDPGPLDDEDEKRGVKW